MENSMEVSSERKMENSMEFSSERKKSTESPPSNDCCPICFEDFIFPCRSTCDHWFCASCILEFWNYREALKPCKCPLCSRSINSLTPEASLNNSQDQKSVELLANIQQYNRLFVGGTRGLILIVREIPFLVKRLLRDMMDPDRTEYYLRRVRWVLFFLGVPLYKAIPSLLDRISLPILVECISFVLFVIIQLFASYRRRELGQRVRQLAANHH